MNRVHTYLGSFQLMQILVQDEPCNPLPVYQVLFAGTALLKEREMENHEEGGISVIFGMASF